MKNINQLGRSMTEMLGVLAIIGVLSISAIAGYSYAMTQHKTNNLINELNILATTVSQQLLTGKNANLFELTNTSITVETFPPNPSNYFSLKVKNIDKSVCQNLVSNTPPIISGIYQNNTRLNKITNCLDKTTLTFVFANDLKQDSNFENITDYACTERCTSGSINPDCSATEVQKDTGIRACGVICAVCLNDECPSSEVKNCPSGHTAITGSKTEYGSQCYTCTPQ
ncbi:MAG: hypothetical protein IKV03_05740 [Alphaproteobacteria bacterium]|nr:hypothetical protein [Alphaproteobacteria bacterium]